MCWNLERTLELLPSDSNVPVRFNYTTAKLHQNGRVVIYNNVRIVEDYRLKSKHLISAKGLYKNVLQDFINKTWQLNYRDGTPFIKYSHGEMYVLSDKLFVRTPKSPASPPRFR